MTGGGRTGLRHAASSPESVLASAVVRIGGSDGAIGGAGFLVAPDLVITCAHVVSDALDLPRDGVVETGAEVAVDLPLADGAGSGEGAGQGAAEVLRWVPVGDDQSGDVALLRLREALPGARPLPMAEPESVWDDEARTVGFTDDHPDGIWHVGRLRGRTGRGWVQLSRADGAAAHVKRGFSGSPVWDDTRGAAVGLLVAAEPVHEAQQAFVVRTSRLVADLPELAAVFEAASPFRGLAAFQEDDAEDFFGRDEDVAGVVAALRGDLPGVTVCGPSGCGKSSVALAGVVPRMREDGYEVLVLDCGHLDSPTTALATELYERVRSGRYGPARADSADQVEVWLRELGLGAAFQRATGRRTARLLVVLDQAEALLNRPKDELADAPEIAETVELLFPERRQPDLRVLVTLRADFLDTALRHPRLGPVLSGGTTYPLAAMSRDQLHTVITAPLGRVPTVGYDPGLDLRILDDVGGAPGNLPLLGFVLEQLWERRYAGRLREEIYDEIGRVPGALGRHAHDAWQECVGPGDEVAARRLLTGLVRVLPGGDAPLRRVLTRDEAGEECWRLAEALGGRRLLVLDGGEGGPERAELAHEALITHWPTLRDQVAADAEFLAARAELDHDRERWAKAGRSAALLPGPLPLAALTGRLAGREEELDEEQREFLALARRRRRVRRLGARAGWISVALVLALIAGLGTFLHQESRARADREAEGRSRTLAVQSDELTNTNPGQAALAAVAAYEISPTQEARSALMRRNEEMRDMAWSLTGAEGEIKDAAMSADGRVTLVTTKSGRATLFLRTANGRVRQEQLRLGVNVRAPVVSRDGRRIAYLRDSDSAVTWRAVTPAGERLVGRAHRLDDRLTDSASDAAQLGAQVMAFSPDGQRLVGVSAADAKHPGRVWDLRTGESRMLPKRVTGLTEVWSGPDANTFVSVRDTAAERQSAVAVDLRTGRMRELADDVGGLGSTVSADGGVLVVCRHDGFGKGSKGARYRAVDVAAGKVLRTYEQGKDTLCSAPVVDRRGENFAVPGTSGGWRLVPVRQDRKPRLFFGPDALQQVGPFPLLGTPDHPVLIGRDEHAVTGWTMQLDDDGTAFSPPKLIGDGSTMVVREGEHADSLRVAETEGDGRTLAEVRRSSSTVPPHAKQLLEVNGAGTLMADVSDRNRITVRALPSLRKVAEFRTAMPPTRPDGVPDLNYRFLDDHRLVTTSGTRVEQWDARTGERLSRPIDLKALHLTRQAQPIYLVGRHREPGHVVVTVHGEPYLHAVNLRTGKEDKRLRVQLGDDLNTAFFLKDERYAAALTVGSMVELWSVPPGRPAKRVGGPLGPLNADRWTAGGFGKTGFFVANNSSIRFLKAGDPTYQESYEFEDTQGFLAASDDGTALLHVPEEGGRMDLLRLDPARWKRHLCSVVGRDFTTDERSILPGELPDGVCAP
ncbi:trypsin-like peptidase domain-containing protein [Streptomyces sp. NPDC059002]|uniref:nSTAND1 domain-containing NTPase n=1 Tax=Streptomyces sp. NPDC059002 TaxID=3346690 RepID=UPI003675567D